MAALSCRQVFRVCAPAILFLSAGLALAAQAPQPQTIQLSIGGGPIDSAAFRWSSALAETLSRPPGLPECDPTGPCGVPGVVAGAQTYDDSRALLTALIDGKLATAVIPAIPLMRARCDPPKKNAGAITSPPAISVLKVLYRHPLYLLVHGGAPEIAKPADWMGKTVVIGPAGSDSETIAIAVLEAYRIPKSKVKLLRLAPIAAFAALRDGSAAVGIFMGHVFDAPISDFIARGYTLMSLPDTSERNRLLQALPALEAGAIPASANSGLGAISTVTQPVVWAAGPALDPALAERLIAAISEVHNQARIADLVDPVLPVPEGEAFTRLPAPAADGAQRFALREHVPVEMVACPTNESSAPEPAPQRPKTAR